MLELLFQLSVGFFIALSGVLIPGPLLAFVTMKTLDSGPKVGTIATAGHIAVELGILSLVAFGLGTLLKSQVFTQTIGAIGGVLLLILGTHILIKSRTPQSMSQDVAVKSYHPFTGGILFSTVLNPSVAIWWMTVGLTTLTQAIESTGVTGGIFWMTGHFSADLIWFSFVSLSVDRGREIIGSTFYKGLLIACGLTLLVFGYFFTINYLPELLPL